MNNLCRSIRERRGVILPSTAFTWLVGALFLSILAGCDLSSPGGMRSIAIGELVEIDEGDTVRLGQSDALLTFEDVHQDSRCPAVCVWQGWADAGFSLISAAGDSMFVLKIPGLAQTPYEENDSVDIGDFTFKLLELNPYPDADPDGGPPQYRALIRAERDGSAQE